MRDELDGLLTDAVSALGQLRIAVRRGQLSELADKAKPLDDISDKLSRFQERHG